MNSPKKKGGAPDVSQSRTDWMKGSSGESKSPMMVDGSSRHSARWTLYTVCKGCFAVVAHSKLNTLSSCLQYCRCREHGAVASNNAHWAVCLVWPRLLLPLPLCPRRLEHRACCLGLRWWSWPVKRHICIFCILWFSILYFWPHRHFLTNTCSKACWCWGVQNSLCFGSLGDFVKSRETKRFSLALNFIKKWVFSHLDYFWPISPS